VFARCPVQISARITNILTEHFCGFHKYSQADVEIKPRHFLEAHLLTLIEPSMLHSLRCWPYYKYVQYLHIRTISFQDHWFIIYHTILIRMTVLDINPFSLQPLINHCFIIYHTILIRITVLDINPFSLQPLINHCFIIYHAILIRITVLDVNPFSLQPRRKPVIHHGRYIPSCTVSAVDHKRALAKSVVKAETTKQWNYCDKLLTAI
jgi:hypothetical protein